MKEWLKTFWEKISRIGLHSELADFDARSVIFANRMTAVVWLFVFSSIFINVVIGSYTFIPALGVALVLLTGVYALSHLRLYYISKGLMMFSVLGLLTYMSFSGAKGSGLQFYYISLTALPVIIFRERISIIIFQACCISCLVAQHLYAVAPPESVTALPFKVFYVVNGFYSSLFIILSIMLFRNLNKKHEEELMQKNIIIEKNNAQLQAVNKHLDSFTYSVSHDLRAPLRSIHGFSAMLSEKYKNELNKDALQYLGFVVEGAQRMQQLINDLLEFSRAGKAELRMDNINMNELTKTVVEEVLANSNGHKPKINIKPLLAAEADYALMKQVMVNLVSNAVKYSAEKPDPEIEIGSYMIAKENVFYVKDNGTGFDMKYAYRLFNVFQRLHSEDRYEGTGVGLAIVSNIVQRHGGRVWVEAAPDKGATFYFGLP